MCKTVQTWRPCSVAPQDPAILMQSLRFIPQKGRTKGSRDTPSITDIGGLFWALSEQCGEEVSAKITT